MVYLKKGCTYDRFEHQIVVYQYIFFQGKCKLKTTMHQFLLTIDSPMLQNVKTRYRSNIFFEPE